MFREFEQLLAKKDRAQDNASGTNNPYSNSNSTAYRQEPPPMWVRESYRRVPLNWVAIVSFTTSAAVSIGVWAGIFHLVSHFLK
jgi:hypothetical protein